MTRSDKSADGSRKLIGDLTVSDARHILACEGGTITGPQIVWQVISAVAIVATTGWAIAKGHATAWHLALPMVAQYVALMVAMPPIYLVLRHPDLRKDTVGVIRLWIGLAIILAVTFAIRGYLHTLSWSDQLAADSRAVWKWIADGHMQWPILIAFVCELAAIPGRVRNLYKYGPPFVGVSLGCAMRFVVLMFGCFLLPWIIESSPNVAWIIWCMILISEVLTLWMLLDIQRSLRKLDRGAK